VNANGGVPQKMSSRLVRRMERGDHLTAEGIERIRALAAQMNRGRPR